MTRRVLICDDSVLMRKLVSDCVTVAGWEVCGEASNGAEAVAQFEKLRPDAVTLDIVMPGTDGLYALPRIIEIDPDAKVVVVSALDQTRLVSEAIRAGAYDFLVKPFLPEQLQTALSRALGHLVN